MRTNNKKGFTIIELLVVMSIILILAGLLMGASQAAKRQAMVAKAKAMISALETAIGMYQADIGSYPATGIDKLYDGLTTSAGLSTANAANWGGPYMEFKDNDHVGNLIKDSWGNNYTYANPDTTHGGNYVDITSNGPDGTAPSADDITNWK